MDDSSRPENSMEIVKLNNPVIVKLTSTLLKTGHFTGDMPHWINQQKMLLYRKQMQHQCQLKLRK